MDGIRTASADHLVRELRHIFGMTGVPVILRTDGGPQFSSSTRRKFLERWEVRHEMSSPTYARANGHAEKAVKAVKKLILKTTTKGRLDDDAFERGLLELRNTQRADNRSPAQILFGHPLRTRVQTHHRAFAPEWQRAADECDAKADRIRQDAKQPFSSTTRTATHWVKGGHSKLPHRTLGPRWHRGRHWKTTHVQSRTKVLGAI